MIKAYLVVTLILWFWSVGVNSMNRTDKSAKGAVIVAFLFGLWAAYLLFKL